jgi:hypothetical protein
MAIGPEGTIYMSATLYEQLTSTFRANLKGVRCRRDAHLVGARPNGALPAQPHGI